LAATGALPDCSRPLPEVPESGLEYHLIHRLGRPGVWRPLVGVVLVVALGYALFPVLLSLPVLAWYAAHGGAWMTQFQDDVDLYPVTPIGFAVLNVGLASWIAAAMLATWLLHGLKPGWLASVRPRIRWRFLGVCLGLSMIALVATLVVSSFLPASASSDGTQITGDLHEFTSTTLQFVLIILILTPLQAAGEEYAFRGYLTQAFGGLFASRALAVVVPAALFALAHGVQSAPVFIDRLAFGLVAGVLVIATGGLEAGIAMHVLNNFLAFGLALAFGDMTSTLHPEGGSWWSLPSTLTQSLVYLWLALLVARRMGLRTTTEPPVLAAP
jgi:membrane protease YdiL (CAAX protease family)